MRNPAVYDVAPGQTREEILKVSMAQNRVDASVNFTAITAELEGFTGSDIKEVRQPKAATAGEQPSGFCEFADRSFKLCRAAALRWLDARVHLAQR